MNKITVMIIDDQPYFRAGVRQALSQQSNFKILDCDTTQDSLALIDAKLPDVVLLGSDLNTTNGLELGRKISLHYPNCKVVMLSPNPSDAELFEIIKSAAVAFLSKNTSSEELISTIIQVSRGEYPINEHFMTRPKVAEDVLKRFQDTSSIGEAFKFVMAPLTNRETHILNLIAEGQSNKQIAVTLKISEQTIKNHVSAILRKLNANDRAHAVALAYSRGLIPVDRQP